MPLRAVLFAEFDVEKGPIISHCYPEHFVDERLQQQVKHLLIPKPILHNHKMCFTFDNLLFIGHPLCIKGHKYKRNELLFNLVLVVEPNDQEPSAPYITALEILAGSLQQLEHMDGWVWRQSKQWEGAEVPAPAPTPAPARDTPPASSPPSQPLSPSPRAFDGFATDSSDGPPDGAELSLCSVLERIFTDLSRRRRVVLAVNAANTLSVRLRDKPAPLPDIHCHEVPVVVHEPECRHQVPGWDLACEVVRACVDGERCVPLIAEAAHMTVGHVQVVLGFLHRLGIVRMADIFQFSNRYVVTEKLADFSPHVADPAKRRATARALSCRLFPIQPAGVKPLIGLLRFYSLMTPASDQSIGRLQSHLPPGADVRRAVQFGVVHRMLRRVHEWPIVPNGDDIPRIAAAAAVDGADAELLATALRGRQCLDALCVAVRRGRGRVLAWLQPHLDAQRCFLVWKPTPW